MTHITINYGKKICSNFNCYKCFWVFLGWDGVTKVKLNGGYKNSKANFNFQSIQNPSWHSDMNKNRNMTTTICWRRVLGWKNILLLSVESERYIHKRANPLGKFETWVRAGEYLHVHKNRIIVVNLQCNNRLLLAQSLSSSLSIRTCDSCAKRNPHIPGNMVTYQSLSQVPTLSPESRGSKAEWVVFSHFNFISKMM